MDNQAWERKKNGILIVALIVFVIIMTHLDPIMQVYRNFKNRIEVNQRIEHLTQARYDIDHELEKYVSGLCRGYLVSGKISRYEKDQEFPYYDEWNRTQDFSFPERVTTVWRDLVYLEIEATEEFDERGTDRQYAVLWNLQYKYRELFEAFKKEKEYWHGLNCDVFRGAFFPVIAIRTPDHFYADADNYDTFYMDDKRIKTASRIKEEYQKTAIYLEARRAQMEKEAWELDRKRRLREENSKNTAYSKGYSGQEADPYDIDNYSDADEFADEWEDEFEDWDDAYMYYEDRRE